MIPRGEHDVGQVGNSLLQGLVRTNSILPYLVGMGRQVHLAVEVAVQDARPLVVEVDDGLAIGFIFEESLVGTDDLRGFPGAASERGYAG